MDIRKAIEDIMNELFVADPKGTQQLIMLRALVNEELSGHSEVPVASNEDGTSLGLLGVLNGVLKRCHPKLTLYAMYHNGELVGFTVS